LNIEILRRASSYILFIVMMVCLGKYLAAEEGAVGNGREEV
jgi:hypothetical protein